MNRSGNPNFGEREETIFNAAMELRDPVKRRAYLDMACGGDPALRARMDKMIAAAADSFFDKAQALAGSAEAETHVEAAPAQVEPRPAKIESGPTGLAGEAPGDQIGRYKLLQKIGEGGCGIVYMAEQEEPVRRRV